MCVLNILFGILVTLEQLCASCLGIGKCGYCTLLKFCCMQREALTMQKVVCYTVWYYKPKIQYRECWT